MSSWRVLLIGDVKQSVLNVTLELDEYILAASK
jgi:hypothetical protein